MTETSSGFRHRTLAEFIAALGSSAPVPGGGSASAVAGALAAALVRMVVALSLDKPKYAAYERTLRRADKLAGAAVDRLLDLADEDAASYAALAAAFRMPRATPEEEAARHSAIETAARQASLSPLEVLRTAWDVLAVAEAIAGRSNLNARSDVATAASLAEAAARGAGANVLINLPLAGDEAFASEASAEVATLLEEVDDLAARARAAAAQAGLREPETE